MGSVIQCHLNDAPYLILPPSGPVTTSFIFVQCPSFKIRIGRFPTTTVSQVVNQGTLSGGAKRGFESPQTVEGFELMPFTSWVSFLLIR